LLTFGGFSPITKVPQMFGLLLSTVKGNKVFAKISWATFFSQTHLVTLLIAYKWFAWMYLQEYSGAERGEKVFGVGYNKICGRFWVDVMIAIFCDFRQVST
jgi:hypothetical protein